MIADVRQDVGSAIYYGHFLHDVAVGRDDDAAAQAMFDLWAATVLGHLGSAETERTEELLDVAPVLLLVLSLDLVTRRNGNIDYGRRHVRGQRLHGAIERKQRAYAVVIERRRSRSRGSRTRCRRFDNLVTAQREHER